MNIKIIVSNILINIIPLLIALIHFYLDMEGEFISFSNFLFTYNFTNSWIISVLFFNLDFHIIKFIIILLYNFIIIFILNNLSNFVKNNLVIITTIFSIISSFVGILYLGINLSI